MKLDAKHTTHDASALSTNQSKLASNHVTTITSVATRRRSSDDVEKPIEDEASPEKQTEVTPSRRMTRKRSRGSSEVVEGVSGSKRARSPNSNSNNSNDDKTSPLKRMGLWIRESIGSV